MSKKTESAKTYSVILVIIVVVSIIGAMLFVNGGKMADKALEVMGKAVLGAQRFKSMNGGKDEFVFFQEFWGKTGMDSGGGGGAIS